MEFMDKDFLLQGDLAKELYNNFSKDMPIFDYHCHLSAEEIYKDKPFDNLYEIWLKNDHYKWRLMRFNGIPETLITAAVEPYECFKAFVQTIEKAIDNPIYHWSHLELKRCFNIDEIINIANQETIWNKANKYIADNQFSPRKAIKKFNVDTIVTTEEIFSTLEYHKLISKDKKFKTKVLPSFRGDKIVNLDKTAITKLGEITGGAINNLEELQNRIIIQLDRFNAAGAVVTDMAFEGFNYSLCDKKKISQIFINSMKGETINSADTDAYRTYMMLFLMREYYIRGWAVQLHIGAKRNNNTSLLNRAGADCGCDSISDMSYIDGLNKLLNKLSEENILGKTIVYNLNPADNYKIATTIGNFAGEKAKIQMGISWWFSDNKYGIIRMMQEYSSLSHFGNFIGMLTDSRSYISYIRHEYFRRILCNYIASLAEAGEFPNDINLLGEIVQNISYNNAKNYFKNIKN